MLLCDDYAAARRMTKLSLDQQIFQGCEHKIDVSLPCAAVLRTKTRANFAAIVDMSRNWSANIRLQYGLEISYGGLVAAPRNRANVFKIVIIRKLQSYGAHNSDVKQV